MTILLLAALLQARDVFDYEGQKAAKDVRDTEGRKTAEQIAPSLSAAGGHHSVGPWTTTDRFAKARPSASSSPRAENSAARKDGGTGLGLTISRSLCRLMGYRIRVESEAGRGSTFTVVLTPE